MPSAALLTLGIVGVVSVDIERMGNGVARLGEAGPGPRKRVVVIKPLPPMPLHVVPVAVGGGGAGGQLMHTALSSSSDAEAAIAGVDGGDRVTGRCDSNARLSSNLAA